MALLLVATTCTDSGPMVPDDGRTDLPLPPEVEHLELSLGFGDAPVAGELRIEATTPTDWEYSIDLDEDGRPDEAGDLHLGVVVPYLFEEVGLHRIRVTLERAGDRRTIERLVVVNDPTATVLDRRMSFEPAGDTDLRGIVFDESGERLFVVKADPDFALIHLDPTDLTERWRLPLPGIRHEFGHRPIQGIALVEETLFVDIGDSLVAVDVGNLPRVLGTVGEGRWGGDLEWPGEDLVFSGGWTGIAIHDASTGSPIRSLDLPEFGGGFAISPTGGTIAYLHDIYQEPALLLLDSGSLTEVGRVGLPGVGEPLSVIYHPGGDRLYVVTGGSEWHLLVVQVDEQRILKDVVLARGSAPAPAIPDRIGWTQNDRYLAVGSPYGVYFIDPSIDHPRFRLTENPPTPSFGCCTVAISPRDGQVYQTSGTTGELSVLRVLR